MSQKYLSADSESRALGIYTKYITPPQSSPQPDRVKIRAKRAERYELLSAARSLCINKGKSLDLEHPHDWHRVAKCMYVHLGSVGVHRAQEFGSFYSGLTVCGSVWACPVCSAKIQERRREEISKAMDWAYSNGLQPVMVTLTFPHKAWDSLSDLMKQQAVALQRLRAGKPWQKLQKAWGYQGMIRSLELTRGANGWHPHTHELWFVGKHVDAIQMRQQIVKRWESACRRAELLDESTDMEAFELRSVDVKGWCKNSDYFAKMDDKTHWGIDREIAKASTKQGKKSGKHPFQLLHESGTDEKSGRYYLEYVQVMKGKRQLHWSKGLKDLIGLTEKTDEQIAEEQREDADLLGRLSPEQWKFIRSNNARSQILDRAETGGWDSILSLLRELGYQAQQENAEIELIQALSESVFEPILIDGLRYLLDPETGELLPVNQQAVQQEFDFFPAPL